VTAHIRVEQNSAQGRGDIFMTRTYTQTEAGMNSTPTTTVRAVLQDAASRLSAAGVDDALREARLLLAHALGTDLSGLLLRGPETALTSEEAARFGQDVGRRAVREPLAFITGEVGFWTLTLRVSSATLIPRPDSETLIDALCAAMPDRTKVASILDLGTGTGCLLLAALSEFPSARGIGVDLAPDAAVLARGNAALNGLGDRAAFLAGSWADALEGGFDVVLSNPPYIPQADIAGLMPEVADFEPHRALDGGPDGLDAYRVLVALLPRLLKPQGLAVFEIGVGQDESVPALAHARGLRVDDVRRDYGGHPRAVVIRRP